MLLRITPSPNLTNWAVWAPWSAATCDATLPGCGECATSGFYPLAAMPTPCFGASPHAFTYGTDVSVPLIALVSSSSDVSITLGVSPTDNLISVAPPVLSTDYASGGRSIAARFAPGYRIGSGAVPLRLTANIGGGRGCTRDVLGRYSDFHSDVFTPPNPNVHYRASGMGSYAGTQGALTQLVDGAPMLDTFELTGYTVNWDATFWWPYIMQIAPSLRPSIPGNYSNQTERWGSSFDKVRYRATVCVCASAGVCRYRL